MSGSESSNSDVPVTDTKKPSKKTKRSEKKFDKNHYQQKYRPEWEKNPYYAPWLTVCKNDNTNAFCKVCNTSIRARIASIKDHNSGAKHQRNLLQNGGYIGNSKIDTLMLVAGINESDTAVENIPDTESSQESAGKLPPLTEDVIAKKSKVTSPSGEECEVLGAENDEAVTTEPVVVHYEITNGEENSTDEFLAVESVSRNDRIVLPNGETCEVVAVENFQEPASTKRKRKTAEENVDSETPVTRLLEKFKKRTRNRIKDCDDPYLKELIRLKKRSIDIKEELLNQHRQTNRLLKQLVDKLL